MQGGRLSTGAGGELPVPIASCWIDCAPHRSRLRAEHAWTGHSRRAPAVGSTGVERRRGRVRRHVRGLRLHLLLLDLLHAAAGRLRRLPGGAVVDLLDRRLHLFPSRRRQRSACRPGRPARHDARRPRHHRRRADRREPGRGVVAGLSRLRRRRRHRGRLRLCAGDRRGAALVRAPARLRLGRCRLRASASAPW